jgi:hypothetical protein
LPTRDSFEYESDAAKSPATPVYLDVLRAGACHVEVHVAGSVGSSPCFDASTVTDTQGAIGQKFTFVDATAPGRTS